VAVTKAGIMAMIGQTLADRYVVERLVGSGGMGEVYAARQLGLDRVVAVKVLRRDLMAGTTEAERFRREALATARLDHPNIVTVYDFGRLPDGSAFLVMEFLAGPSLEQWLAATPEPDPATVVGLLEPACDAVDAMHAAGIVHRDIKPANIALPDPASPHDVVKLIDLGIARFADSKHGDLTGQMIIGTAEFIAPEVATGGPAGPSSDLYALGVTAFWALAGSVPFTGLSDREILIKHIKQPPPLPSRMRPSLPRAFDDVLARSLAKDPAERYQTARELASALRAATAAPVRRATRTVLLVEGDAASRELARGCIAALGYEVVEATDGVDALLELGARPFDVVLLSAGLTGFDAETVLRLMREKGLATPAAVIAPPYDAGGLMGVIFGLL
jgi:serine/threonine-protein kinase